MHVISRAKILEFCRRRPNLRSALDNWYRLMKSTDFTSFVDLRRTFPSADRVGNFTVFNIAGNNARLIAAIHYNRKKIYIRHILTHPEYDRGNWKKEQV